MLRRTKDMKLSNGLPIVNLPSISVENIYVDMFQSERELYNKLFEHSKARLHTLITQKNLKTYVGSMFDLLLRLRQLCDHPYLIMSHGDTCPIKKIDHFISKFSENSSSLYITDLTEKIKHGESFECPVCLDVVEDPIITKCVHIMCRLCANQQIGRNKNCPLCKTQLSMQDVTTVPRESKFSIDLATEFISSSKIDALITILNTSPEPSVVFSQ